MDKIALLSRRTKSMPKTSYSFSNLKSFQIKMPIGGNLTVV